MHWEIITLYLVIPLTPVPLACQLTFVSGAVFSLAELNFRILQSD